MLQSTGKYPILLEFMSLVKIGSKDLARKVIYKCRYNTNVPSFNRGHRKQSVFFKNASIELELKLCVLYLD